MRIVVLSLPVPIINISDRKVPGRPIYRGEVSRELHNWAHRGWCAC